MTVIPTRVLRQAISMLIAADGVICSAETQWGIEIDAFFNGYREEEFRQYYGWAQQET
jgi:hypothetical protein